MILFIRENTKQIVVIPEPDESDTSIVDAFGDITNIYNHKQWDDSLYTLEITYKYMSFNRHKFTNEEFFKCQLLLTGQYRALSDKGLFVPDYTGYRRTDMRDVIKKVTSTETEELDDWYDNNPLVFSWQLEYRIRNVSRLILHKLKNTFK
jgi:hypothetical protein